MATVPTKTNRSANFASSETQTLLSLIQKYKRIIEGKETDTNSNRKKNQAWIILCKEFNALSGETPRDVVSLKNKYNNLKKRTKVNFAQERYNITGTGGRPSKPSLVSEIDEAIKEIAEQEVIIRVKSQFDSDLIQSLEVDVNPVIQQNLETSDIDSVELVMVEDMEGNIKEVDENKNEVSKQDTVAKGIKRVCED